MFVLLIFNTTKTMFKKVIVLELFYFIYVVTMKKCLNFLNNLSKNLNKKIQEYWNILEKFLKFTTILMFNVLFFFEDFCAILSLNYLVYKHTGNTLTSW